MSLVTQINNLATRVGTEFKAIRSTIGSLPSLTTTDKSTVVAAVNEVRGLIGNAGAQINDVAASGTTVYSSSKTDSLISTATAALVNTAPSTMDTLNELATALGDDPNFATTMTTALGNRVRFDAAQTLTSPQKVQALSNIGGASATDVGDPATDFVAVFVAALA
jgi:phosphopantothenoylcysteine synthetase/decarboxylase